MTIYLALLRGINVGTKNRIKMDALQLVFEEIGLDSVQTYIQSGNVLFTSDSEETALRERIEGAVFKKFGITAPVILRTAAEMHSVIEKLPFSIREIAQAQAANTEGESLYVYLMHELPDPAKIDALQQFAGGDRFCEQGRNIYLLLSQSIRNSKLALQIQRLSTATTARNWNTILKLYKMMQTMLDED